MSLRLYFILDSLVDNTLDEMRDGGISVSVGAVRCAFAIYALYIVSILTRWSLCILWITAAAVFKCCDSRDFIMDVYVNADADADAGYMYVTAPFWIFAYIYNWNTNVDVFARLRIIFFRILAAAASAASVASVVAVAACFMLIYSSNLGLCIAKYM